jgi:hypothetical protein
MDAIEDAYYDDASCAHLPIISELIRRCKNRYWFCLAGFVLQKRDQTVIW